MLLCSITIFNNNFVSILKNKVSFKLCYFSHTFKTHVILLKFLPNYVILKLKKNSLANSTSKYSNTQSLLSLSVSSFNFRSPHFVVLCSTRTQNFHRYSSFARLAHSADLGAAIFKTRCPKCNAN